ncbi:DUF2690 domain-containing protein [Dactylosporangium sp. NPDC051541]|uniref:DUF2690 domain-containing protein n=1 Tax=Dactylosporangium sp. NPDC051541 TaxID=3363977 RepID=UPI0037957389
MRTARRIGLKAALLVVLTTSIATIALQAPASAAACSGASCYGRNPEGLCSSDATGLLGRDYINGSSSFRVELRYSPSCQAGWMRLIVYPGSGGSGFAMSAWNQGGPSTGFAQSNSGTSWTNMIDGSPGKSICGGTHLYFNGAYRGWYDPGCAYR